MVRTHSGYDFVIVGAGTAGCVLAARLSEDPGTSVLLLEAGSATPDPAMAVPQRWPTLSAPPTSWGDITVPQRRSGVSLSYARGKALGGSSAINGMVFARGHRASYDSWVDQGAKGWGFDDLLPYFRRSETALDHPTDLRGSEGPLQVSASSPGLPATRSWIDALVDAGIPPAADISGGLEEGFGWPDQNVHEGVRQSAADAYLTHAVRNRPNLDIVTDAQVQRLAMAGGRCTGVGYLHGGRRVQQSAREVVLAAGTIGSAQLLLLSGIGRREHLAEVGVETLHDLPGVGANFQDHVLSTVVYQANRPLDPVQFAMQVFALVRSTANAPEPDLQLFFVDAPLAGDNLSRPNPGYAIAAALMRPHSRGSVRLASREPADLPLVDPNFLGDQRDLDTLADALERARDLGGSPSFDGWRAAEAHPGPGATGREALQQYVLKNARSYHHPVGTCRIGTDDLAVVDTELRVHGLDGLRVADASVMPSLPSANTNATVAAIAERAAAMIRGTD